MTDTVPKQAVIDAVHSVPPGTTCRGDAIIAAINAIPAVDEWQPIETAPKDGTEILVWRSDAGVLLARWTSCAEFLTDAELDKMSDDSAHQEDWFCADFVAGCRMQEDCDPTHWRPLPKPPLVAALGAVNPPARKRRGPTS